MAVSIIETIKSKANAGNTAYIVVVKLLCDDYSDLPAQSGLSGYELAQGCIAHVINENKDYMIDSNGNWHVYGGDSWTNVYTKSETDALLDDKQDELTTAQLAAVNSGITAAKLAADEAALAGVVDNGAKNLLKITSATQTINGVTFTVNDDQTITINGTSQGRAQFSLKSNSVYAGMQGYILSGAVQNNQGITLVFQRGSSPWTVYANDSGGGAVIQNYDDSSQIQVYINVPVGVTVSNLVFKPMICTAKDYAVSPKFVPYSPTNRELYEMILALQ